MPPPTVLGFYLLLALGPHGPVGRFTESLGIGLPPFTFTGLVIGSVFSSLPFVVQPIQNVFEAIGARPLEAATLRASPRDAFRSVALPLARPGIVTGAIVDVAGEPLLARITRRSADKLGIGPALALQAQIKAVALLA